MQDNHQFDRIVSDIQAHTATYGQDPHWRTRWLGFTDESRNIQAQQLRAFGQLVGSVTETLRGWRVLDVGCGEGRWLRTFIEYGALPEDLFGVDVSKIPIESGRPKNPLVTLVHSDGHTIPFADNHFNLVTQFTCFSNIPTMALRQRVAEEMRRVLCSGGYVYWFELPRTTAPSDPDVSLHPSDYFPWPIQEIKVTPMPRPGECLRPLRGVTRILGPFLDRLGYPAGRVAALIGPKP